MRLQAAMEASGMPPSLLTAPLLTLIAVLQHPAAAASWTMWCGCWQP